MTKQATRVLVTNDDGIDGEGLRVLTATLVAHGYEPIVIAPDSDYSGAGTSIISRAASSFSGTSREIAYQQRTPCRSAWSRGIRGCSPTSYVRTPCYARRLW